MGVRPLCALVLVCFPAFAAAAENPLGLSYVETADLRLIYFDALEPLVPQAIETFTNSLAFQRKTFGLGPSERITVLLKDSADNGNAHALPAPNDRLFFDVAPQSHAFETNAAVERFYSTMNHELVHISEGDVASDQDRFWRHALLGKVQSQTEYPESLLYSYLTTPRFVAPRWYLEGEAVFMDTWMSGGLGRAQGGFDEMVFRAMVRDGTKFYDPLGLVSKGVRVDFQVGANAYLYGTRFITWLAYQYSPQQVVDWVRRDEASKRYYEDQFRSVFGLTLDDAWQKWIAFEGQFQTENLAQVRQHPITPIHQLAANAIGSISRVFFDEKSHVLYGAFRYPGVLEYVGALNTVDGTMKPLSDIKRGILYRVTSLAYDPQGGTLFFTNNNVTHRDLMAVDIKTGQARMLIQGARIGEIVFNPTDRSLIGIRHARGLATLVRIPYPYDDWTPIHTFPYEYVPSDLDISPDGKLLSASVGELNGDQFVRVWEIDKVLKEDFKPVSEFRFGQSVPESFVFSKDGKYLYGSSYYTGVSNIFRYDVATGDVTAVSNAEIGFFRPVPLDDGKLLILSYTGDGFVPATIDPKPLEDVSAIKFLGAELAEKYPVVKSWQVPAPNTVDPDKLIIAKGPYVPLENVSLQNAYPVLQGYKNSIGLGYHASFSDPISFANLGITVAETPTGDLPESQRGHVDIKGDYLGWRAEVSWNKSDFYDLFGPTKISRKGDAVRLGYDQLLIYDNPRKMIIKYDLVYLNNIDTLPDAQNVVTPFTRLTKEQIDWSYSDLRRSLGAVDDEKGIAWDAIATAYQVEGTSVGQAHGDLDMGWALPIPHASIWWRNAIGYSGGNPSNPVANFYFGGFGNNYVDSGTVKRFEEFGSFPGFGIDDLSGQHVARVMLEANLPPFIFESAGSPGFHAEWLRPTIFASELYTSTNGVVDDPTLRSTHFNVGTQEDIHFSIMHWNELTLSFGYAAGFQGSGHIANRFMISLKIL
jgi:hypothetical protein